MTTDSVALVERLGRMLRLRPGHSDILDNRESTQLEFKESFNLGSRGKYVRTMASFANNKGGFIVFGVQPSPHRLKGVNLANFEGCDPAKLTEFLNAHLSPEIEWEMARLEFAGFDLGFLFASEAAEKPVIAITSSGNELQEGEIYYRHKGQSTTVRYPELREIIEERLARERRAWVQHFQAISRAGPTNVGILDTIHGRLFGGGPPFLVDESLLRKLKFIRKGRFSEIEGAPTLRLIGDVQPVAGIAMEKPIAVGIHVDDLVTAFLAQRALEPDEARSYLRETSYQPTPYVPLQYFYKLSGLGLDEATDVVSSSSSAFTSTKKALIGRLRGEGPPKPVGAVAAAGVDPTGLSVASLVSLVGASKTEKERRSALAAAIASRPEIVRGALPQLPVHRLVEAVTHLGEEQIATHSSAILELLLTVFSGSFATMIGSEKSAFRKAVTICDEALGRIGQ